MVEDGVFTRCASSEVQFGVAWEVVARASLPWHALSSEKASDSVRAEGSSTVHEPGEC